MANKDQLSHKEGLLKQVALSRSVHGQPHDKPEMVWALLLANYGRVAREIRKAKESLEPPDANAELNAKYYEALRPEIESILSNLCAAVVNGQSRVFFRLAECVEAMAQRGENWAIPRRQKLIAWMEAHPDQPANVLELAEDIIGADRKTIAADVKELRIKARGKPGRPSRPTKLGSRSKTAP